MRCLTVIEAWKKLQHSNVVQIREVFTTKAFGDGCKFDPPFVFAVASSETFLSAVVFVYDYYPTAETLKSKHFSRHSASNGFPTSGLDDFEPQRQAGPRMVTPKGDVIVARALRQWSSKTDSRRSYRAECVSGGLERRERRRWSFARGLHLVLHHSTELGFATDSFDGPSCADNRTIQDTRRWKIAAVDQLLRDFRFADFRSDAAAECDSTLSGKLVLTLQQRI